LLNRFSNYLSVAIFSKNRYYENNIILLFYMINIPFFSKSSEDYLGIDIGTSSIKAVEISGGKDPELKNYGEVLISDFEKETEKKAKKTKKGSFSYTDEQISEALTYLLEETGIKTRKAYFSLPDFASFFTSFNLPPMEEDEVDSAVSFHARQYIPLPVSEVSLDWFLDDEIKKGKEIKVNLIAIPNEVIKQYQTIANMAKVEIVSLEGEMVPLVRAFARDREDVVAILDIGEQTMLLAIAEKGILKATHSLEFSAGSVINQLASFADVKYNEAKKILSEYGLKEKSIEKVVFIRLRSIFAEVTRAINSFERNENKEVAEVIITGGFSNIPGIEGYIQGVVNKKVSTNNCFQGIKYPESLEKKIIEISKNYGVALGTALGGTKTK
jgi:type IV pilus assembly protein PilM